MAVSHSPSVAALEAAAWVVNMESGPERSRLRNGHMARRKEVFENSYRTTDHSEADAWLIRQYIEEKKAK